MLNAEQLLTLFNLAGFGKKAVSAVVDIASYPVSSTIELLDLIDEAGKANKRIKTPSIDALERAIESTQETVRKCELGGYSMVGFFDSAFPRLYKGIPDRPLLLFTKGELSSLNADLSVAIIGTREPTDFGERAGRRLASLFAENGFVVVSGLAKGCDTVAHRGCLAAHGKTVAILAGGIDDIYPKENRPLAEEILDTGGCLLSEYKPGTKAHRSFFIERDRLQSGLSQAVVVIETDVKGGTMHTVGFAADQNRPVACLAGHPESYLSHPKVQGTKKLISDGTATRLGSPEEIEAFIAKLTNPSQAPTGELVLPSNSIGEQGTLF